MKLSPLLIIQLNWKKVIVFSVLIGIVSSFVIPPFNLYFLEFFLFIPVLYLYHPVNRGISKIMAFCFGLFTGAFMIATQEYWLIHTLCVFGNISLFYSCILFLLYIFYSGLKLGLLFFIPFLFKNKWGYPVFICLLCSCFCVELLFVDVFPIYIGNGQLFHSYFVQIADIIGVQGISVLVLMINFFFYKLLTNGDKKNWLLISIVIFVTYSYSFLRTVEIESYKNQRRDRIYHLNIGVVQPNFSFEELTHDKILFYTHTLINETNQLLQQSHSSLDLIVWPESAIPFSLSLPEVERLRTYIQHLPVPIIYNTVVEIGPSVYNSVVFQPIHQKNPIYYYKNKLVPFGEYVPMVPWLHKYFQDIGTFQPGTTKLNFNLKQEIKLAPQLCYEITIPSYTREFIKQGGNLIVNLTNDSWFGYSRASVLHMFIASFRAIENRVPIVRATNTGVSALIDIKGWPVQPYTRLFTRTSFVKKVDIFPDITALYTYCGNYTLGILLLICFIRGWWLRAPDSKKNQQEMM